MTGGNLSMYGTTVAFRNKKGMVEQVMLGQVYNWSAMPNSIIGVGFESAFYRKIAEKSGLTLDSFMELCDSKNT